MGKNHPHYLLGAGSNYHHKTRNEPECEAASWKKGDVIKIELDTKERIIKCQVNEIDHGIVFRNIVKDKIYTFSVSFMGGSHFDSMESIQLMDFQMQNL